MQHPHPLRNFALLVVEDNPSVLEATGYLIEAAFGCTVLSAASCVEALALIDEGSRVDLIFSDVVLPGKDGLTLARLARERLPNVSIVLTTGWQDEIDSIIERGYVALLKPYKVEQLEAVFSEALFTHETMRAQPGDADALHLPPQLEGANTPRPASPK